VVPLRATLNDEARQRFGIDADVHGVLIVGVRDGGPAADEGLQPGDVIEQLDGHAVTTPAEVKRDLEREASAGKKQALLLIDRNSSDIYLALSLATS